MLLNRVQFMDRRNPRTSQSIETHLVCQEKGISAENIPKSPSTRQHQTLKYKEEKYSLILKSPKKDKNVFPSLGYNYALLSLPN